MLSFEKIQTICNDYNKNKEDNFAFVAPRQIESHIKFIKLWRNTYDCRIKFLLSGDVMHSHFGDEADLDIFEISNAIAKRIKESGVALTLNNHLSLPFDDKV